MKQYERLWLDKVNQLIEQNISNPTFSTNDLIPILAISRTKLSRDLVKLTGFPPSKYLLNKRLIKAKELLEIGLYPTIEMTALAVGFKNGAYFSKRFAQKYKVTPTAMLKTKELNRGSKKELLKITN